MPWDALTEPLGLGIVQRALLEVTLVGLAGGVLGCWIVLYGSSYSAESLAHGMFPGLVVAAIVGFPVLLGAAAGALAAAIAIALAGSLEGVGRDTAIGIVVTTMFAAGALIALSADSPPGLQGLLFGDVLGVSGRDLAIAAALTALVLAALRLFHGRLLAVGFDRASAGGLGISAWRTELALLVLTAAAVIVAVQALGNLLAVAVLVGPAATARLLTDRLRTMMLIAGAVAVACGVAGIYVSYYAGTAAGASIAGAMVAVYLVCAALPRRHVLALGTG